MAVTAALPDHTEFAEPSPPSGVCQRWRHHAHSWVRTSEGGFNPRDYTVEPISEAGAKAFTLQHHYSKAFPAATRRYGLYDITLGNPELVGVAVYSIPAQARVLTNVFPDLEPYRESVELGRFCLLGSPAVTSTNESTAGRVQAPKANAESWFLARTFTQLAADGIRGVVSFADPVPRRVAGKLLFPGHVGLIYQASGAVLTGRGTARRLTVLPDGTSVSDRALQKVRGQEQGHEYVERRLIAMGARPLRAGQKPAEWLPLALADVHAIRMRHNGNLRYAMLTSRRDRRTVTVTGGPVAYPKQPDA